jgi:hypothetical protein
MPGELTILYYTANRIGDEFARRVRAHLAWLADALDVPVVSVSQQPVELGRNICVGEIGFSTYNVYRQVLAGAEAAETEWVACCEDDTLYTAEHLTARPPADEFWYNTARWWVEPQGVFRWRNRTAMHACVAPRELMVETLRTRFSAYPTPLWSKRELRSWGEPGRYEGNLNLPQVKREFFTTTEPIVTFDHKGSLYGLRRWNEDDKLQEHLPPWGSALDLLKEFAADGATC